MTPSSLLKEARANQDNENLEKARELYQRLMAEFPGSLEAKFCKGWLQDCEQRLEQHKADVVSIKYRRLLFAILVLVSLLVSGGLYWYGLKISPDAAPIEALKFAGAVMMTLGALGYLVTTLALNIRNTIMEGSRRLPLIPRVVRLYGTALVVGSLAYIFFILFLISLGVRGGIPDLVFGGIMAYTGLQFRYGKRGGVFWLSLWLILGPVYLFFGPLPPTETRMAAMFFFVALLGLPAIAVAFRHWHRFW